MIPELFALEMLIARAIVEHKNVFRTMTCRNVSPLPVLVALGTALVPVYVFPSGSMQPVHLVFAFFFVLYILHHGVSTTKWTILFGAMFVYALLIESIYTIIGHDPSHLIRPTFYLYNLLLCMALYGYVKREGADVIVPGIIVAVLYVTGLLLVTGVDLHEIGPGGRDTATFNNPNQLGYFSVCLIGLAYLFRRSGNIAYWLAMLLCGVAFFLAIASLSKSAMITCFVISGITMKPEGSRTQKLLWLTVLMAGTGIFLFKFFHGAFGQYVFAGRLLGLFQESDTSFAERGYFAIEHGNSLQTLFGLGTGNVFSIVGHEVHSTFGSVLNTYGIFGLMLFGGIMLLWWLELLRGFGLAGLCAIAGPPVLYGVMHNGTRFTIFWILFATSLALARGRISAARCDKL